MISPVKVWRRQKQIRAHLGKKGTIISWTTIYVAPTQFKHIAPYTVVYVRMKNNDKATGMLVDYDPEDIYKDMPVQITLRKLRKSVPESVIPYTIVFKAL